MELSVSKQFKHSVLFMLTMLITGTALADDPSSDARFSGPIAINPAYQIKRMSNGDVYVFMKDTGSIEEKHKFTGLYADLILAAYRRHRTDYIIATFSKRYYLSENDCRREVKHAINVLADWNIIIRGDEISMH